MFTKVKSPKIDIEKVGIPGVLLICYGKSKIILQKGDPPNDIMEANFRHGSSETTPIDNIVISVSIIVPLSRTTFLPAFIKEARPVFKIKFTALASHRWTSCVIS